MNDEIKIDPPKPECDLEEGIWDTPCQRTGCIYNINKAEASNCFLFYKYFINDKQHTLYDIAGIMRVSHTTIKQVENETLKNLSQNPSLTNT